MTTTLSSAGGVSLITDGTGPSLEIKGLTGGVGFEILSTAQSLAPSVRSPNSFYQFMDDFHYSTNGTAIDLSDDNNPFQRSIWRAKNLYPFVLGIGMDINQVQEWPGGGNGVIKFLGVRTGNGAWQMTADNSIINMGGDELVYNAALYIDQPSWNYWEVRMGLFSDSGLLGFKFDSVNSAYVQTSTPAGITGTTLVLANITGQWNRLKMVVNATLSDVKFYFNDMLVDTRSSLGGSSGFFVPYIAASRTDTVIGFNFYVDYIQVTKNSR